MTGNLISFLVGCVFGGFVVLGWLWMWRSYSERVFCGECGSDDLEPVEVRDGWALECQECRTRYFDIRVGADGCLMREHEHEA